MHIWFMLCGSVFLGKHMHYVPMSPIPSLATCPVKFYALLLSFRNYNSSKSRGTATIIGFLGFTERECFDQRFNVLPKCKQERITAIYGWATWPTFDWEAFIQNKIFTIVRLVLWKIQTQYTSSPVGISNGSMAAPRTKSVPPFANP